jgi:hypothetical protein
MPTYVFDRERGIMVDKATREPMVDEATRARPLQTPMTYSDLPGYRSPIDGSWIEGRRARAYDLQKNGCIEAGDIKSPAGGKLKNAKFAEKHGLTHLLER